jgi:hypothetical protein
MVEGRREERAHQYVILTSTGIVVWCVVLAGLCAPLFFHDDTSEYPGIVSSDESTNFARRASLTSVLNSAWSLGVGNAERQRSSSTEAPAASGAAMCRGCG